MKTVTIPEKIGKWIEFCNENSIRFLGSIDPIGKYGEPLVNNFSGDINEVLKWIILNQELYLEAWVNGYDCLTEVYQVYLRSNDAGSKLLLHKRLLEDGRIGYEWSCFNIDDKNYFTINELIGLGLEWLFDCPDAELIYSSN